jgi:hypothetical protein
MVVNGDTALNFGSAHVHQDITREHTLFQKAFVLTCFRLYRIFFLWGKIHKLFLEMLKQAFINLISSSWPPWCDISFVIHIEHLELFSNYLITFNNFE